MTFQPVGILGGMGPEATILLQQRLLARIDARDDADHLPLFIDMNPQVPSRIAHLIEGTGEPPGPTLARMAQRLEQAGATALAMPCNTAHAYAGDIQTAVQIPLLHMVDLAVVQAAQQIRKAGAIGILASPATQSAGVFDPALARAGLSAVWPENPDRMLSAIRDIKANGPNPNSLATLVQTASELQARGADLLLIGCSEFSLLTPDLAQADRARDLPPLLDTLDVLAQAIHTHILSY
ncbi:MAG: amino acid racemase [Pelagimonas sp.]|jgi:aspartate racemase|nr:amino acid racemase [Pelagimonas sp.]